MSGQISAGDLRHRVTIEQAVRTDDGAGGASIAWQAVATVAAAIWPRTSGEVYEHDRVAGRASHDIWLRHRDGVLPAMRITFGARTFDILGVIDIEERGRWLKCPVEERDL